VTLSLRPVGDADDAFLLDLYARTRESELALTPWTEDQKRAFVQFQFAAQKQHYAVAYPDASHQAICADGEPVGRVYLARGADEFHILDVTIAPARRNAGIGSEILGAILTEAAQAGKPVTIYVESFNPSVHLFERLGFRVKSSDSFLLLLERPSAITA